MFQSALLKLTGLYLLILMAVSVFFSLNLYRISTTEINNRLSRQINFITSTARPDMPGEVGGAVSVAAGPFEERRKEELQASKEAIIMQLVYANIVILVAGGLGSYFLARRTIEPIEEAHAAQSRFAADASHELRTPLAVMRTETEVTLRSPKLTLKEARHQLHSNLEELERLTELSDGLLQLARGSSDSIKEDAVPLQTIVNDAIKQRTPQAAVKKMQITSKKILKTTLRANQTQLTQALVIILDNAIKYSPEGSRITIWSKAAHNHIELGITDTGMGMNTDEVSQIFERFYRADTTRSSGNVPGYGLGLAIAQQIVESHHGTLSVNSKPGSGSTFIISLPLK